MPTETLLGSIFNCDRPMFHSLAAVKMHLNLLVTGSFRYDFTGSHAASCVQFKSAGQNRLSRFWDVGHMGSVCKIQCTCTIQAGSTVDKLGHC
jgi:hypothetical protein